MTSAAEWFETRRRPLARRRLVAIGLAAVAVLGTVACEPPAPPPGPPTGECRPDPFTAQFQADIDALGAGAHHVTAAVYDDRTGCWYHLRQGQVVTTASVVKIEIMAAALLRAQDEGRDLSDWEVSRITPMIHSSDDPSASALWGSLGGEPGMAAYGDRLGLTATVEIAPKWGLTETTAEDQVAFVHRLLQGDLLQPSGRAHAWWQLRNVREDQRWGVGNGVPEDWEVGLKNGFFASECCGWRVNSVGYVADPEGGGYTIAVLSDGWRSLEEGIPMVETVAGAVAGQMVK
jgi:Beta-lactamase enzyme family